MAEYLDELEAQCEQVAEGESKMLDSTNKDNYRTRHSFEAAATAAGDVMRCYR